MECLKAGMNSKLYNELERGALLFERNTGLVEVRGPDRVSWLQGMVSNDVARPRSGQGCYAAHLSPQGKVLSQMVVLAREETLWLELETDDVSRGVEELNKLLIMEDAEIFDRSSEFTILSVVGNGARSLLEAFFGKSLDFGSLYAHSDAGAVVVVRAELGYDLIVPVADVDGLRNSLVESGAVIADKDLWDCIRIEAGLAAYGADVDSRTTLPELGEKGIDYDKGCYIGQEVVAKIKYIGHVNRRLIGLKFEGEKIPEADAKVSSQGRDSGRITSSVYSPQLGSAIALGYVRLGADKPGTVVEVGIEGDFQKAIVTELPFVSHEY